MARYRKIHVAMYADAKFRSLSRPQPNGQSLWTYLLTGPHTTAVPGLSSIGEAAMAESLGWTLEGFREAFREVSAKGMAKADWDARVVWVPNAVRYNPPESPNVIKSWAKGWEEIPECALKVVAFTTLKAFVEGLPEAFREVFRKAFPPPFRESGTGTGTGTGEGLSAGADVTDPPADSAKSPPAAAGSASNAGKANGAKARKRKPDSEPKPEHAELRAYFCEQWKSIRSLNGDNYAWKHGRDDAHAKWVLDHCDRDPAKTKAIVNAFMADDDDWLVKGGHEIGLLVARFNRYRARPAVGDADEVPRPERSIEEIDALLLETARDVRG
jgi:hypothetical protein